MGNFFLMKKNPPLVIMQYVLSVLLSRASYEAECRDEGCCTPPPLHFSPSELVSVSGPWEDLSCTVA